MYFLCFTAYFTTPFAKYPEHFNQPLTEMASGPQFTTVEFGSLLPSRPTHSVRADFGDTSTNTLASA